MMDDKDDGRVLHKEVPLRGLRGVIAATMTQSLRDSAQLTLHRTVSAAGILEARERSELTINDILLAATASTLAISPDVNATVEGAVIRQWTTVNLGMAVAIEGGLVVPVIRDAASRAPEEIRAEARRLAELARKARLGAADIAGGTFTVTNLGAFSIDMFTPIINPPQAAILGVGRIVEDRLGLSLTIDHRALDGAVGAKFLSDLAARLEDAAGWATREAGFGPAA